MVTRPQSQFPAVTTAPLQRRPAGHQQAALVQRADATRATSSIFELAHLQRAVGNRAVTHLIRQQATPAAVQRGLHPVIQRDIESAAQALLSAKKKRVAPGDLKSPFLAAHNITLGDKDAIQLRLDELRLPTLSASIKEAARTLKEGGVVTVKKAHLKNLGILQGDLADVQIALKALRKAELVERNKERGRSFVAALDREVSTVSLVEGNVRAYLDRAQMKHQPPSQPIGDRETHGGAKFKEMYARPAWHQANTLRHMIDWANSLTDLEEGVKREHGQGTPVDGVHYEGFCMLVGEIRYVLFHCYPAKKSPLLAD